jgi:putative phosphoserine phosphatase/1-acylglycerol-3-phosphate O-acyltransferase
MAVYKSITREIDEGPGGKRVGAFFDLDRTIIAGFSALAFWLRWGSMGRVSATGVARAALATARFGLGRSDFSSFVAESAALLTGVSESEWSDMGRSLFTGWLAGDVFPEARALVRAHQRAGHTVAVVSSATRYQVEPIAADLGIEAVMCTELEVREGAFTGNVVRPTCYGEGKARAAKAFAAKHGIQLDESYFYSDSDEDIALLNIVGRPRPINPNRRLRAIAAKRGWPARTFSSRGTPRVEDVVRTSLALASLGPSLALGLPLAALDGQWRSAMNFAASTWGELGTALAGVDLRVHGEEHLWSHRPAVFIFNHQSAIDMLLLCKLLRRDFVGIGKQELRHYPILGRVFAMAGTVFIDRSNHVKAVNALQPALEALRSGVSLAIAPEGTRSTTPTLGRFKKGAFHLAMRARVPVVPIDFVNALDALPRQGVIIRRATVKVVVHPPISTESWSADGLDEQAAAVRELFVKTLDEHGERA